MEAEASHPGENHPGRQAPRPERKAGRGAAATAGRGGSSPLSWHTGHGRPLALVSQDAGVRRARLGQGDSSMLLTGSFRWGIRQETSALSSTKQTVLHEDDEAEQQGQEGWEPGAPCPVRAGSIRTRT